MISFSFCQYLQFPKTLRLVIHHMIYLIQTPQAFNYKKLFTLQNNKSEEVTDDANLFVSAGKKIKIIKGEFTNNKITINKDIRFARSFHRSRLTTKTLPLFSPKPQKKLTNCNSFTLSPSSL